MECITDIQNPVSESMHSRYINVDSEGVIMCHWTVGLINMINCAFLIFENCNHCIKDSIPLSSGCFF